MDANQSLVIIHSLIEQCNAAGLFKKLKDLDVVRSAYNELERVIIKNQPNEKTIQNPR
jgi:glycerol dehydrogenase-like iron-containing ADH family enzyme